VRGAALVIAPVMLLAGCAEPRNLENVPDCGAIGQAQLTLIAQAVPSAELLPCVKGIPTGWMFEGLDVRSGQARFWLGSDRDGSHAVTVLLRRGCDIEGTTEAGSEQSGVRRFERVTRITSGYGGERHYRFGGGCITYRFDLHGTTRAEPLAAVSEALGFATRDSVARRIEEESDGRLHLDPTPAEGRR
jgi:hypothetical protein